jgi:hypothetical protein
MYVKTKPIPKPVRATSEERYAEFNRIIKPFVGTFDSVYRDRINGRKSLSIKLDFDLPDRVEDQCKELADQVKKHPKRDDRYVFHVPPKNNKPKPGKKPKKVKPKSTKKFWATKTQSLGDISIRVGLTSHAINKHKLSQQQIEDAQENLFLNDYEIEQAIMRLLEDELGITATKDVSISVLFN